MTVQGMKLKFEENPLQGEYSEPAEYISPIFFWEKTDGTQRLILNVKNLNKYPEYQHFRIQTFQGILTLIQPNCYMATIELKDVYYSVKIDVDFSILFSCPTVCHQNLESLQN